MRKIKRKSKVQKEVERIKKYVQKQRKQYGDFLVENVDEQVQNILNKYKTKEAQLKHLQKLSAKQLQENIRVIDPETGEIISLAEQQKRNRQEAQLGRKVQQGDLLYPVEPDVNYYPSEEEIVINNAGSELAVASEENWQYEEFAEYQFKAFRRALESDDPSNAERLGKANELIDKMVDRYGEKEVARALQQRLGSGAIQRIQIHYDGHFNRDFVYSMLEALGADYSERREFLDDYIAEDWID